MRRLRLMFFSCSSTITLPWELLPKCILLFILCSPVVVAQGWQDITPSGLAPVHKFKCFSFENGGYALYAWSQTSHKGYRLTPSMQWDSIFTYSSFICDPIFLDYIQYHLVDLGQSLSDPNLVLSVFVRTGCITECFSHVYMDTTGNVSFQYEVKGFDDFLCTGFQARIVLSPLNTNEVFMTFFDSLYYSSDHGTTFQGISSPDPYYYNPYLSNLTLSPYDTNIVFTSGYESQLSGFLYRSVDKGRTWTVVLPQEVRQMKFHPFDQAMVFAVSESGIYKSTNGGVNWFTVQDGRFRCFEVDPDNPSTSYAGSFSGELWRSTDNGSNWTIYNNSFSNGPLHGIYKLPNSDTLIVGALNGVFKVYESFVSDVDDSRRELPMHFQIYQNYPNPFNPTTTIKYQIPRQTDGGQASTNLVTLKVYDLLGREVRTLVSETKAAGEYSVTLDATGLVSGVYFYRLTAGSFVQTRKLVLLR